MARSELDAWFAKADDVLTDWRGSEDAMTARAAPDDADPELPLLGDNTADQAWPLPRPRPSRTTASPARRSPVRLVKWAFGLLRPQRVR